MSDRDFFDAFAATLRASAEASPLYPAAGDQAKASAAIAVYRNNVRSGLSKALREKFPVIEQLVGEAFFKFATLEYFRAHPPVTPLLADYGDQFPTFLETFPPAQTVPYLADVARFEIAWLEAYRAADAEPLSAKQIHAAGGSDPHRLCFSFHPSLRLLQSDYPVASIWRRCREKSGSVKFHGGTREQAMIVRPYREVVARTLSPGNFAMMEALNAGNAVGAAFGDALAADPAFDPQAAFQILYESGVVVAAEMANEE